MHEQPQMFEWVTCLQNMQVDKCRLNVVLFEDHENPEMCLSLGECNANDTSPIWFK